MCPSAPRRVEDQHDHRVAAKQRAQRRPATATVCQVRESHRVPDAQRHRAIRRGHRRARDVDPDRRRRRRRRALGRAARAPHQRRLAHAVLAQQQHLSLAQTRWRNQRHRWRAASPGSSPGGLDAPVEPDTRSRARLPLLRGRRRAGRLRGSRRRARAGPAAALPARAPVRVPRQHAQPGRGQAAAEQPAPSLARRHAVVTGRALDALHVACSAVEDRLARVDAGSPRRLRARPAQHLAGVKGASRSPWLAPLSRSRVCWSFYLLPVLTVSDCFAFLWLLCWLLLRLFLGAYIRRPVCRERASACGTLACPCWLRPVTSGWRARADGGSRRRALRAHRRGWDRLTRRPQKVSYLMRYP